MQNFVFLFLHRETEKQRLQVRFYSSCWFTPQVINWLAIYARNENWYQPTFNLKYEGRILRKPEQKLNNTISFIATAFNDCFLWCAQKTKTKKWRKIMKRVWTFSHYIVRSTSPFLYESLLFITHTYIFMKKPERCP